MRFFGEKICIGRSKIYCISDFEKLCCFGSLSHLGEENRWTMTHFLLIWDISVIKVTYVFRKFSLVLDYGWYKKKLNFYALKDVSKGTCTEVKFYLRNTIS